MEYAESLERAHRRDGRTTNIYVEHPHRPCRPAGGGALQPTPDPSTCRKANCSSPAPVGSRAFTIPLGIQQLPPDDHASLKSFVCSSSSSSSNRATDFMCTQTICYQKPLQDRENVGSGRSQPTERLLSTAHCGPPVPVACYPAPHDDDDPHHKPTITTRFLQPSFEGLPSRIDRKPFGCRTPSQDQQRREILDTSGGVIHEKYGPRRIVISDEVCPRCGKPRKDEDDQEQWTEGEAGYGRSRLVDAVSCLCCVKAVFYHCCSEEDDDTHCSDAPCSCTGRPLCCPRWTCLVLAGLTCLPCLVLYWPCRILLRLVARCRGLCTGSSCACAKAKEGYDACAFRKF